MKRKGKIILFTSIGVLSALVLTCLAGAGIGAYFTFLHHYKGTHIEYNWTESDVFSKELVSTVQKKKDKDFVILNFADIQMCDLEDVPHFKIIHDEMTELVERVKPDLITLTGDQTWSNENLLSLKAIIRWLDGYKIPYAPVFGNHDIGNDYNSAVASLEYCCDLYEHGKYSLFKRGPSNLDSLGNYCVNIEEDGKIVKSLYMVDFGVNSSISPSQIAYFKWLAEGNKSLNNGEYTSCMAFMHKPITEYWFDSSVTSEDDLFHTLCNRGLTDVVCGHFHQLNYTEINNGVNMTFACKTGELVFYSDDGIDYLNGGTSFTLKGNDTDIQNHYVDRTKYHIDGSENVSA